MNFLTLGRLALAVGLASSPISAFAQEPAATTPAATEATEATATPATPAAPLKLSNKWRIEVSEGANNTGTLLFRVTPDKGVATDVLVQVEKGRGENGVATDIKNTFKKILDPKVYHVETDDGEDVLVKKRKGPNYEVQLVESTLKGTRVHVEKE
ncbi:MAG: hypothetical protein KA760_06930 [Steroidobacteraceae bacterium]|jgi:hypothetical protein|nr:hypothetical protein [Steroidobacteraceae bacterium]MBP9129916.1 hypothetical protein [Steroidobacteraceae bacterium]